VCADPKTRVKILKNNTVMVNVIKKKSLLKIPAPEILSRMPPISALYTRKVAHAITPPLSVRSSVVTHYSDCKVRSGNDNGLGK
jgi:UPF0288 family protein (methanogenesis marker protein 3)